MISKQTIYTKGFAVGECLVCTKHKRRIRIYISLCIKHKLPKESSFCAVFLSIIKGKEEREKERSYEIKFTSFNLIFCQDDFFAAVHVLSVIFHYIYVELEIYQPSSALFST